MTFKLSCVLAVIFVPMQDRACFINRYEVTCCKVIFFGPCSLAGKVSDSKPNGNAILYSRIERDSV